MKYEVQLALLIIFTLCLFTESILDWLIPMGVK